MQMQWLDGSGSGNGKIIFYLTGTCLILAAVSLLMQKQVFLSMILLGVFLLLSAIAIHLAGMMTASVELMKMNSMTHMLKDLGLAGGAFFIAGSFKS